MSDLHGDLDRRATRFVEAPDAFERVLARARSRRVRRRLAAGLTGTLIALITLINLWWAFGRDVSAPIVPPPPSQASPVMSIELRIGLRTERDVGFNIAAGADTTWVQGARELKALDPVTGLIRDVIPNAADYDYTFLAAMAEGVVVASGQTVTWLDVGAGGEANVRGTAVDAAAGDEAAWIMVAPDEGALELWRTDLSTGQATLFKTLPGPLDVTDIGGQLGVGEEDLWVATSSGLLRVDPVSGSVERFSGTGTDPVVVDGSVWVANGVHLQAVDTRTGNVRLEVRVDMPVSSLATDGVHLWVLTQTGSTNAQIYEPDPDKPATVLVLDVHSGAILSAPLLLPEATPAGFSVSSGHAWVGFHATGRVYRIDACALPC